MNHYDTSATPGAMMEVMNQFNTDFHNEQLKLEVNEEKKWLKIIKENKENELDSLIVKCVFYEYAE